MLVKDIMNKDVATCTPTEDLACASRVMQEYNCGFVPVVDNQGSVAGVVTDRDICLAVGSIKARAAARIPLSETMSHPVFTCNPNENIKVALAIMARHRVRRLPVVDEKGHLQGVLSVDDIVHTPHRRGTPTSDDIIEALRGCCRPARSRRCPCNDSQGSGSCIARYRAGGPERFDAEVKNQRGRLIGRNCLAHGDETALNNY